MLIGGKKYLLFIKWKWAMIKVFISSSRWAGWGRGGSGGVGFVVSGMAEVEESLCISGPTQFNPVLFEGRLYCYFLLHCFSAILSVREPVCLFQSTTECSGRCDLTSPEECNSHLPSSFGPKLGFCCFFKNSLWKIWNIYKSRQTCLMDPHIPTIYPQ